jgi:diguanylate cyclase (GGDEF)-like protein
VAVRQPAVPKVPPAVAVPALNAGSVVATLTLGRASVDRAFTDDEKALLEAVAPLIGTVVANALLRGQLREASLIDPLTGLYNRAYLDAALEQLLALRRRLPAAERNDLSLIMFDIDGFRALNERHGQAVGDQVLRALAALLRQRFRASDTLARVGGDAFVVVLDGANQQAAVEAAGQVRAQLREMALGDERGNALRVSVSAGCAMFRDEAARSETILRTVEAALDTARWSGPGAVVAI